MTRATNRAENNLVDWLRGDYDIYNSLPDNWYLGLASAASDSAITEITGAGMARLAVPRNLVTWAGTQGAGSTLASSGSSHITSNNIELDWGTATDDLGDANYVVFYSSSTLDQPWFYITIPTATINEDDEFSIATGELQIEIGLAGGMSDFLANRLIDLLFRDQEYQFPSPMYMGYSTTTPNNAGGNITEPSSGGYERAEVFGSIFSSTQGDSNTPSSGTSGQTKNLSTITWPAPTGDQGVATDLIIKDASTLGNLLFAKTFVNAKTVSAGGGTPKFDPEQLSITFD